jgi:hypothetical protein
LNALHLVAHHGHDHCVQSLIDHGAIVDDLFFKLCLKNNRSVMLKKITDENLKVFSLKDVFSALYYWNISFAFVIIGVLLKAFFAQFFAKPPAPPSSGPVDVQADLETGPAVAVTQHPLPLVYKNATAQDEGYYFTLDSYNYSDNDSYNYSDNDSDNDQSVCSRASC